MDFFLISIMAFLPAVIAYKVAVDRNRSGIKGCFVGLVFGWIGLAILALTLRTRDKKTGFLK